MEKIITPKNNTDKNIIAIDFNKLNDFENNMDYVKSLFRKLIINQYNINLKLVDYDNPHYNIIQYLSYENIAIILESHQEYATVSYVITEEYVDKSVIYDIHENMLPVNSSSIRYIGNIKVLNKDLSIDNTDITYDKNRNIKLYNRIKLYETGGIYPDPLNIIIVLISNNINGKRYYKSSIFTNIKESTSNDKYYILENDKYKFQLNSDGTVINLRKTNTDTAISETNYVYTLYDTTPIDATLQQIAITNNKKYYTELKTKLDNWLARSGQLPIVYVYVADCTIPAIIQYTGESIHIAFIGLNLKLYTGELLENGTLAMVQQS